MAKLRFVRQMHAAQLEPTCVPPLKVVSHRALGEEEEKEAMPGGPYKRRFGAALCKPFHRAGKQNMYVCV